MGSKISCNNDRGSRSEAESSSSSSSYKQYQELKMERWIHMHYQIKEREKALELARDRELFFWLSGFYLVSLFGCFSFYQRSRNAVTLVPLVPLTFFTLYHADSSYGSKRMRIQAEAELIMQQEPELLQWPDGLPSVASIDEARAEMEMEKKMHPHQT